MTAIDLSKQQALDGDPNAIQQINFKQILIEQEIQESFSFLKKQRKVALDFSQGTAKVLYNVIKWYAFYQYK